MIDEHIYEVHTDYTRELNLPPLEFDLSASHRVVRSWAKGFFDIYQLSGELIEKIAHKATSADVDAFKQSKKEMEQ